MATLRRITAGDTADRIWHYVHLRSGFERVAGYDGPSQTSQAESAKVAAKLLEQTAKRLKLTPKQLNWADGQDCHDRDLYELIERTFGPYVKGWRFADVLPPAPPLTVVEDR